MRCKFCDAALEAREYAWSEKDEDFIEQAGHKDGACLDPTTADTLSNIVDDMYEDT